MPEQIIKTAPRTANKKLSFRVKVRGLALGQEKEYIIENLSLLLGAGIDVISALKSIQSGIRSRRLKRVLADLEGDIAGGLPLSEAIEATGLLSRHVIALIRAGEDRKSVV